MKRRAILMILLMMLLCSCSNKKEAGPKYDLGGKTYYNTVDDYGNEDHSKVWFGKDGSFVFNDIQFDVEMRDVLKQCQCPQSG